MYNAYPYWYNLGNTGIWDYMARTLEQIISELNPTFQPQVQSLQERANLIPGQIASEEAGLQAKQDSAFGDIVSGARRRGLGFSGVPLGEQAKYTATDYLPALARLRQSGQERAYSLQDAILGINERRDTLGQQIYQTEQDRSAQERAAKAASAQPTLGSLLAGLGGGAQPRVERNKVGGFSYFDANNTPITAYQYAQRTGTNFGEVLRGMAEAGDASAGQLYRTLQPFALDGQEEFNRALNQLRSRGASAHILGGS